MHDKMSFFSDYMYLKRSQNDFKLFENIYKLSIFVMPIHGICQGGGKF